MKYRNMSAAESNSLKIAAKYTAVNQDMLSTRLYDSRYFVDTYLHGKSPVQRLFRDLQLSQAMRPD